jgi:hypothetical protein
MLTEDVIAFFSNKNREEKVPACLSELMEQETVQPLLDVVADRGRLWLQTDEIELYPAVACPLHGWPQVEIRCRVKGRMPIGLSGIDEHGCLEWEYLDIVSWLSPITMRANCPLDNVADRVVMETRLLEVETAEQQKRVQ